jgi:hypothetical protein
LGQNGESAGHANLPNTNYRHLAARRLNFFLHWDEQEVFDPWLITLTSSHHFIILAQTFATTQASGRNFRSVFIHAYQPKFDHYSEIE